MKQTLLIIDAQQELIDGNQEASPIFNKEQLIRSINKVIGYNGPKILDSKKGYIKVGL